MIGGTCFLDATPFLRLHRSSAAWQRGRYCPNGLGHCGEMSYAARMLGQMSFEPLTASRLAASPRPISRPPPRPGSLALLNGRVAAHVSLVRGIAGPASASVTCIS